MAASMHGLSKSAPVTAPIISDDYELGFFNCITGYMMSALSTSQSMGLLQVIPCEGKTVRTVMASCFPSIPAATTPTRLVSLQTIAYIQALGIHSLHDAFQDSSCQSICPQQQLHW